jgi:hypothetical protein
MISTNRAYAIVKHFPSAVIKQPERVFIGVLALVLGCGSLLGWTPSIHTAFPAWIALEWGVTLFLGGLAKTLGLGIGNASPAAMSTDREELGRSLERLGSWLVVVGSFTYVGAVIQVAGGAGFVAIATYTLLGVANLARLLSSSAGRSLLEHSGDGDRGGL